MAATSKRLRFEVFHRDSFTCQYCGRRPPEVVLELDHIYPQSRGGQSEELNLITSCLDCNRGKSDKILSQSTPHGDADLSYLKAEQERLEYQRYLLASQERERLQSQVIERVQDVWCACFNSKDCPAEHIVRGWLARYDASLIEKAIEATVNAYVAGRLRYFNQILKYVSAVLRNMSEEHGI